MRASAISALLVLALGAAMSFVASRFVDLLRRRAAFLQRLRDMRPDWLNEQPPILPVIALRAALSQAETLSSRYWLTGQNEVEARLNAAANILAVVDRLRQVREGLRRDIKDLIVLRRAGWRLDLVVRGIHAGPLADADVTRLKALLDDIANWGDPAKMESCYWSDLKPAIDALCAEFDDNAFAQRPRARAAAQALLARLRATLTTEPPTLREKNLAENDYGRLKILWEVRRHDSVVDQLTTADFTTVPIDDAYMAVDNYWWRRLKDNAANCRFEEQDPAVAPETYRIVMLVVRATDDPALSDSYLVRSKLTWDWTITNHGRFGRAEAPRNARSSEPRMTHYATRPGKLSATVQIRYEGDPGPVVTLPARLNIARSGDFRIWRFFEASDMIATLLALIVSIVSGLALYAFAPGFGTAKDFLALFTWAAGLDQGKNFLQSLATYAPAQKPGAAGGAPG
jgi:hypothetical protein